MIKVNCKEYIEIRVDDVNRILNDIEFQMEHIIKLNEQLDKREIGKRKLLTMVDGETIKNRIGRQIEKINNEYHDNQKEYDRLDKLKDLCIKELQFLGGIK